MARISLLDKVNLPKLSKGIYDNIVLSELDIEGRKSNGEVSKKMIYLKFVEVDPKTRAKKRDIELSWWKPDPIGNKYFQDNMLELSWQLNSVLSVFVDDDAIDSAFNAIFASKGFQSVEEIKAYNWKKSEINAFIPEICGVVGELLKPFVGVDGKLLRLKIATDYKGMGTEIPRYGAFVEEMTEEETTLKFTKSELKQQSNAGITATK